jgi:hypothetical protein
MTNATLLKALLITLLIVLVTVVLWLVVAQPSFPGAPSPNATFTPRTLQAPLEVGSFETLSGNISRAQADALRQNGDTQYRLSREAGAVEITPQLLSLGREAFYTETFGNEFFFSDIAGVLDGPINLLSVGRAIMALGGGHTNNLQIRVDEDITVGGQLFPAGTLLDTGLDVPPGWLVPLGMQVRLVGGRPKIGVTCALCHAAVDPVSGTIIEGAPNTNLDTGLILAMASNSAVFFRNTGVNPMDIPPGLREVVTTTGEVQNLPDAQLLEEAVERDLLAWPPGNFDSTIDMVNNPSQIPSSYTFETWPYGWNGFSTVGWFRGLTTLNNNVHALNSDATTGFAMSEELLGIDMETYFGILLQNAATPSFRLPPDEQPSGFFNRVNPSRLGPAVNNVEIMPEFPNGSPFIPDGLMINTPGLPFAEQLNAISAFQHTLAPPPSGISDVGRLENGARVFDQAGCAECHSGRFFTNHTVIPQTEVNAQPSRALALADFTRVFEPPSTYPPSYIVPVPDDAQVLEIPMDEVQVANLELAYTVSDPEGGYKVQNLIGLLYTAPYMHDGGVAAGPGAFREMDGRYRVADTAELGLPGTLLRGLLADPSASLRALVDRELRESVVEANRLHPELQRANVDGSGHEYWVDEPAGYSLEEQNDLILFLLSIDDNPAVLPSGALE